MQQFMLSVALNVKGQGAIENRYTRSLTLKPTGMFSSSDSPEQSTQQYICPNEVNVTMTHSEDKPAPMRHCHWISSKTPQVIYEEDWSALGLQVSVF